MLSNYDTCFLSSCNDNSTDFLPRKHDESRLAVLLEHTVATVRVTQQNVPLILWPTSPRCANRSTFFQPIVERANIILLDVLMSPDYKVLTHLTDILTGEAKCEPDWKVALVGATLEDDVALVANRAVERGLPVTILARCCISHEAFIDVDELVKNVETQHRRDVTSRLN